jgi:hypothetical protein
MDGSRGAVTPGQIAALAVFFVVGTAVCVLSVLGLGLAVGAALKLRCPRCGERAAVLSFTTRTHDGRATTGAWCPRCRRTLALRRVDGEWRETE